MTMIEKHGHGGDIWTAAESIGVQPQSFLDYSANINPLGPPKRLIPALTEALQDITRYPDPVHRVLRRKISEFHSLSEEQILIGNGAAECIQLAVSTLQPKRVGLIHPCFSEYESAARKAGSEIVPLITKSEHHFLPIVQELVEFARQINFLFIGHPNNPTGNHLSVNDVREVAATCNQLGVTVGIDEAFLDFLPEGEQLSLLPEIEHYPNVILFRSMTKMFAIPGLRLGYCIAHPKLITRFSQMQIPWSVNHLAQKAGEILLDEKEFVLETQEFIQVEREYLVKKIKNVPSVRVYPSKTNYLLLHLSDMTCTELQKEMALRGVLIRNCSMYPGLGEGYIRLAVRGREENEQMLTAFIQALEKLRARK